jgi:hypothetical protein
LRPVTPCTRAEKRLISPPHTVAVAQGRRFPEQGCAPDGNAAEPEELSRARLVRGIAQGGLLERERLW